MSRDNDAQRWEAHKKLIIFLFYRYDLRKTMRLLKDGCDFDAK